MYILLNLYRVVKILARHRSVRILATLWMDGVVIALRGFGLFLYSPVFIEFVIIMSQLKVNGRCVMTKRFIRDGT